MISAVSIASKILSEPTSVEGYKNFLKAGGSKSPLEILDLAGVNLREKESFDYAMKEFKWALDMLKKDEQQRRNELLNRGRRSRVKVEKDW